MTEWRRPLEKFKMADEDVFSTVLHEYNTEYNKNLQSLKKLQKDTLESVQKADTIAVLPTGYGKSLIYELLPSLYFKLNQKPAFVIVVVPLNVILDQQLEKFGDRALNASKLLKESSHGIGKLLSGHVTYLFGHPEHLVGQKKVNEILLQKRFQEDVKTFIIVDEAHCVLEWGSDFRPSFQKLGQLKAVLPTATVLALTATLSLRGQSDVARILGMNDFKVVSTYPARDNITLVITKRPSSIQAVESSAQISVEYCLEPLLIELLETGQSFPLTIVYISGSQNWVGLCYQFSKSLLGSKFYQNEHGPHTDEFARVVMFHASLEKESDMLKNIIIKNLAMNPSESPLKMVIATVALGMGADLTHVKRVIQIGPPKTMEAYVQQIGRAGRSGDQATAILYYNMSDLGSPQLATEMKDLCKSDSRCRREMVNSNFGFSDYQQIAPDRCCDICNPELHSLYTYKSDRLLRCTLRNTILSYINKDQTGILQNVLSSSTVEQLVLQPHKYSQPDNLKADFNLEDSVMTAITTIINSVMAVTADKPNLCD